MWTRVLVMTTVVIVAATASQTSVAQGAKENDARIQAAPVSSEMVFEIRSYHIEPGRLAAYRAWVDEEALPYISKRIDVVGFWVGSSDSPEIAGAPLDDLGSANVTWIIRWPSMEERHKGIAAVFSGPEWEDIFSRVPGGAGSYLRIESRFAHSVP